MTTFNRAEAEKSAADLDRIVGGFAVVAVAETAAGHLRAALAEIDRLTREMQEHDLHHFEGEQMLVAAGIDPDATTEPHHAHSGHRFGGGYARASAMLAGDPDWMNATGGTPEPPTADAREAMDAGHVYRASWEWVQGSSNDESDFVAGWRAALEAAEAKR